MRYEMLGSLRVDADEGPVAVGARRTELLLAVLLVRAGQVVSPAELTDEIWGSRPPQRATAALHVYVSQLRKFLAACRGSGAGGDPIVTRAQGYLLQVEPDSVDTDEFQSLVARGAELARQGRRAEASGLFSAALLLYRGPVLPDVRGRPAVDGFAAWAEEARLECLELLFDQDLELGRHREAVAPLRRLVADHPLREGFGRQLMLALHRSERRGEALRVYADVCATLDRELGLEPGRRLRQLREVVLRGEDDLAPTPELVAAGRVSGIG